MKLLSRLVIALAICLVAILAVAPVAAAAEEEHPEISVYPSSGHPGEEIRVYGTNFSPDEKVRIYYYIDTSHYELVRTTTVDEVGEFSVKFVVPESAKGEHRVKARSVGGDEDSDYFTVKPMLEISPKEGAVDTEVTIKGMGFGKKEGDIEVWYYLDSTNREKVAEDITANEKGSWKATFTVPTSSKGEHKIDAKGDDSSFAEVKDVSFEVKPGISISKSSGYVGDSVTVKGSGFEANEENVKITYDNDVIKETEADENGAWEISLEIPPSTTGEHKIDAYGKSTKAKYITDKYFTISSRMTLTPTEGDVGTSLTVSGDGFAGKKRITVTYDGVTIATAETDSKGSLSGVSFEAPASKYGDHTIAVNGLTANFVMESTPPAKPTLTTPANSSRIGVARQQTPKFEWSAVTDPSGVSYNFQLSQEANFSTLVIPELKGLTQESYAIASGQALPYGTYYWRVKAIDGAQNIGEWSEVYSFKVGLLPFWAFIAIIALIVVLVCILVYFFAIRRRGYYD